LILAACADGGGIKMVQRSDQDVARLLSVNDNLIVPGERIGPVFLGMTETQLYKKLGEPSQTNAAPTHVAYVYPTLVVEIDTGTHKVWYVGNTSNSGYSTAEGIKIGSSGLAVRTQLAGQYSSRVPAPNYSQNDYANGLSVLLTSDGSVYGLSVWIPGGAHW
jgi:hypothetical protein